MKGRAMGGWYPRGRVGLLGTTTVSRVWGQHSVRMDRDWHSTLKRFAHTHTPHTCTHTHSHTSHMYSHTRIHLTHALTHSHTHKHSPMHSPEVYIEIHINILVYTNNCLFRVCCVSVLVCILYCISVYHNMGPSHV